MSRGILSMPEPGEIRCAVLAEIREQVLNVEIPEDTKNFLIQAVDILIQMYGCNADE